MKKPESRENSAVKETAEGAESIEYAAMEICFALEAHERAWHCESPHSRLGTIRSRDQPLLGVFTDRSQRHLGFSRPTREVSRGTQFST